jgi:hypothetical protein
LVPHFGLFKKKKADEPGIKHTDNENNTAQLNSNKNILTLSLHDALSALKDIELKKEEKLTQKLSPIRQSVEKSMNSIRSLADNLEQQEIKLEEDRFKSIVENSRKTVLLSIRREASTNIPSLGSIQDARKFAERLASLVDRFGEVSGSHSRVFNVFIKKYAGKLKDEFETLSSLLKKTKSLIEEFETEVGPITKCKNLMNVLIQGQEAIKSTQLTIDEITNNEVSKLQYSIGELRNQLSIIENSTEFEKASLDTTQISSLKQEEAEFRTQTLELFSHLSRAITKYSYGLTKETLSRLQRMSNEPWTVFVEDDIQPYRSLLIEIKKSLATSKISIKDSDKTLRYIDIILNKVPEFEHTTKKRRQKLQRLLTEQNNKHHPANRAKDLRQKIEHCNEEINQNLQLVNKLKAETKEKNVEIDNLKKQAEDILVRITGKGCTLRL